MRAVAPGRVNLIGDHTDYTGGLVFPMTIDRYTTIDFTVSTADDSHRVHLSSRDDPDSVTFQTTDPFNPAMHPRWGRYVAAVASLMSHPRGITGDISTTIPVGAGLSSSAALELSVALALGANLNTSDLATLTQQAEYLATGVPTGIMDQLCIASGRNGHGTLIDCRNLSVRHVPIPNDIEFIVRFITHRTLEGSEYATRVAQCTVAEEIIGPLRDAHIDQTKDIADTVIRMRAQHVIAENERVLQFADALAAGNFADAGEIMTLGHWSLSHLFETSTPHMDAAVRNLLDTPGVLGARMTGGGFGGCVVAMVEPGTEVDGWRVHPVDGAHIIND